MIGWLKNIMSARAQVEQGTGTKWLSSLIELMNGPKSASGVAINEDKAMTIAAVFTAVRIIAGEIGALPLHVYKRTETGGRESAVQHWAYPLLHDSPNEYHTAMVWRELLVGHLLLWGNSFHRIEWLGNGAASSLYPLMPWDVEVKLTSRGVKYYQVSLPDGREDLPDDEVIHVPGLSYDGLSGLSVVGKMRDSLGEAKANDEFAGAFFANGAKLGGILEVPGRMKEEAQKSLVNSLAERFAGKEGAFKALVLEEGAKWHGPTTMPLRDAQFLEGRKFKRSEIFGWYGLPPHLGGDTERQTTWGTGIEQMDIGFAKHTITPICVRIEQELNRKLFGRGARLYCKHNLDALMRGDFKSRMEGYQIAVGRPFLSVNEVRELEDWDRRTEAGYNDIALPLNTGTGATPPKPAPASDSAGGARGVTINAPITIPENVNHRVEHVHNVDGPREMIETAFSAFERSLITAAEALATSNREIAAALKEWRIASGEERTALAIELRRLVEREQPRPIVQVNNRVEPTPIEVNVNLPARKSTSTVDRNQYGEIIKVEQTETDA